MKIRNLPYNELNEKEKIIVKAYRESKLKSINSICKDEVCNNSVEEFWEKHRENDTNNGKYDGWIIDELQELVLDKIEKEKNEKNR